MTQRRIIDFGTPAEAADITDAVNSLTTSAILNGFQFQVDGANRLRIEPGVAVTHQGLIITEDSSQIREIENTSNSVDYTVYYSHINEEISGGSEATLIVEPGLFTSEDIEGVILGYVQYPGSGVPLSQSHFIQPIPLKLSNFIPNRQNAEWLLPLKGHGYLKTFESGPTITINDIFNSSPPDMHVRIRNNNTVSANGVIHLTFPYKINDIPFSLIQLRMQIDSAINTEVSFIDTQGVSHSLHVGFLQPTPEYFLYELDIPRNATQTPLEYSYVEISFEIPSNRQVKLQGIGLSTYNLPV